jgi:hypothetical protein
VLSYLNRHRKIIDDYLIEWQRSLKLSEQMVALQQETNSLLRELINQRKE